MRNKNFGDFVDKKKRDSIKQLRLIKKMLESHDLKVEDFLESKDDSDPYIYCHNTHRGSGFGGVRIYKIGNQIAFRVQKENKTHPYGSAYPIPVEDMFHDYLSEKNVDQMKAGKKVVNSVAKELKKFFEQSEKANKKDKEIAMGDDNVLGSSTGTDYSSSVYQKA